MAIVNDVAETAAQAVEPEMDEERSFGKRFCLECQQPFVATYAAQLTCSPKCKKSRSLRADRIRKKKRILEQRKNKKSITELRKENERLAAQVLTIQTDLDSCQAECERLKQDCCKYQET